MPSAGMMTSWRANTVCSSVFPIASLPCLLTSPIPVEFSTEAPRVEYRQALARAAVQEDDALGVLALEPNQVSVWAPSGCQAAGFPSVDDGD